MRWTDFYIDCTEWADSTIRTRISSLETIGTGDEIVDAVQGFSSEKLKDQLIRKAIRMNAIFSQDDFIDLENEISDAVYLELAAYTGFDADNPEFNEDNLTWDDFCDGYSDWSDADTLRRIDKLKNFGTPDEVCDVLCSIFDSECEDALYQKALSSGVKFKKKHLEDMCRLEIEDEDMTKEEEMQLEADIDAVLKEHGIIEEPEGVEPRKLGFFGTLLSFIGAFSGSRKRKCNSQNCDGNCNACPGHYGYRYGRWYYGRGHRHGCQRGGKGNDPKRTTKD